MPGAGVDGPTYDLHIEFADVLNLPPGAKVFADGVRVGQLTGLGLVDPVSTAPTEQGRRGYVVADVAIRSSVQLPVGTTAALRQETPLGDVHIALRVPVEATVPMPPGATIPLAQSTPSLPIEDIFAGLATFVGSGAVTDIQSIVTQMNAIMPDDPRETARIAEVLGGDLVDLGDNLSSVDAVLDGLTATGDGLRDSVPVFADLLTSYGVQHTVDSINAQIGVIFVLTALGPVAPSLSWLAPILQSLDGTTRAVVPMLFGSRPLDADSPSTMKQVVDLIQNKIIPFVDRGPKINVVSVTMGPQQPAAISPEAQTARIVDTLRMIGVLL
ncbi:MlaD family protein [Nocardia sp. NPDC057663]|uniref:MlaD family protein n=1 Tax=Nocardia sp. NPDC057663 TaxID=3346201 RepID=UPI00366D5CCF